MIRLLVTFASLMLLAFCALVSPAAALAPAGGGWLWQNPLPFGWDLGDVAFADAQHAWATTYVGGVVMRSSDAGLTWEPSFTGVDGAAAASSFVDGLHGAVLSTQTTGYGGADVIAFTADGGSTWTTRVFRSKTYGGLSDVDFVDPAHGWLAGGAGLFGTDDGGASWTRRSKPAWFEGVDFVDAQHGWATTGAPRVLVTADGGKTWAERDPAGRWEWLSVTAVDAGCAWAHGWRPNGADVLVRTTDGGRHWRTCLKASWFFPEGFTPVSRDEAWLVTEDEALGM